MVRLAAGTDYWMLLEAMPYRREPADLQSMAVFVNGILVADLRLGACARQAFELTLPGRLVGGDVNPLTFPYAHGAPPSEATGGISAGGRRLAVGLLRFEFEPDNGDRASS